MTLWLSGMIEQRLLAATSLDINTKTVLAKFVRAALLTVGVLFALEAIGFDLTLLSVFGGALGVGIGLGLQKLAANYIAGFTILIDKSIRLGDLITVDNRFGVVSRVTSRYVVVRSVDGTEAIVPNEILVTTSVLHHPHPSQEFRLVIPIQVAYDTDVALALRLMEEAARAEPSALKDAKAPVAQLTLFAEMGIQLELIFWVREPELGQGVAKSAVGRRVLEAFRANGIALAPPRRRGLCAARWRCEGRPMSLLSRMRGRSSADDSTSAIAAAEGEAANLIAQGNAKEDEGHTKKRSLSTSSPSGLRPVSRARISIGATLCSRWDRPTMR